MIEKLDHKRDLVPEEQLPQVCSLCWDWIWYGEVTIKLEESVVHMQCYKVGENE